MKQLKKSMPLAMSLILLLAVVPFSYAADLPTIAYFRPYEVGDIVIFGPAGTDENHVGHSGMLGDRQSISGTWKVQIIDCMPIDGVTANYNVAHGTIEKILTHPSLADGTWSQDKQNKREQIINKAVSIANSGSQYIVIDPPRTSDVSFSYIDPQVTATKGSNYVIQPDSIFANPPGTHDYFYRQKGIEVNRFTCCGFTEHIYETRVGDIVPHSVEYREYAGMPYKIWDWPPIYLNLIRIYCFWPANQRDCGYASMPIGPEVKITSPENNKMINKKILTIKGEAKDVSGLLQNKFYLKHTKPDMTLVNENINVGSSIYFSNDISNLDDGKHKLEPIAYDKAGNVSTNFSDEISEFKFLVDTLPPLTVTNLASSTHEINKWYNKDKANITTTWTAAQDDATNVSNPADVSGIGGYGILWNTSATSLPPEQKTIEAVTSTTSGALPDGKQYFHIKSVDKAGNWDDAAVHIGPFWIDKTPPNIAISIVKEIPGATLPGGKKWIKARIFGVTVTDPIVNDARSGLKEVLINGAAQALTQGQASWSGEKYVETPAWIKVAIHGIIS